MAISTDGTIGKDPNSSTNQVITTPDIDGGTIDGATIGSTTPAAVYATPAINKGPAIITTFAGTVTATASTTVTFSSAADAILAGYNAVNPVLGTTLISNALTRYIVSWTNATTAVVDSAVTWAGTAITSVQLPIATFVDSAGVTQGWMLASGVTYLVQNVGIGTTTPGTILTLGSATPVISVDTSSGSDTKYLALSGSGAYDHQRGASIGLFGVNNANSNNRGVINIYAGNNASGDIKFHTADAVNRVIIKNNGNVGIGTTGPSEKLTVVGNIKLAGTTGGLVRKVVEATGTPSGTTTYFDIAVAVPSGARLLGAQLRVDTALTAGETWGAAYVTGSTTTIAAAGQAVAKSTKINKLHVDEITTNTTNIRITRDAGNFTDAAGVIRAIVYFESLDNLADAP